jgi:hypothetical protein
VVHGLDHQREPDRRSCLIDGEVVCCDEKGAWLPSMCSADAGTSQMQDAGQGRLAHLDRLPPAFLYAFDLLELNGDDLRALGARSAACRSETSARLRADGLSARLQDGAGGDRFEAPWVALQIGLAQVQEPGGFCCEA